MKLNEYQELSKRTLPEWRTAQNRRESLSNYAMGLAGESGEVVDLLKKSVYHGHQFNAEELKGELGDVLHYLAGLATMCGMTLEDVASANIAKLQKRYPKGFSKEASINRGN